METVVIKLSKIKIALLMLGSALFVLAGIWIFMIADEQTRRSPIILKTAGIAAILFFGVCFIYGIIKLFDSKPGLIIDDKGITDNSSGVAADFISWQDIVAFSETRVHSTRFLQIHTSNPESYLEGKNAFKRKMMRQNYKTYGTPLSISTNSLNINFDNLEKLLKSRLEHYNLLNK